ncbi:MAG: hypothetical protein BEU04_03655 [Marine Group III euryarchaeote CG-Bathy1]|uniref:2-dehydropantoate 2-reductase n=1 Tax=Marine Group III euryarchaeote CG-Bathy1 TaxID=1889001 RepID=A0A1J5TIY9_9ARCH|nr:MAG: hypothetical protein BEU04_03655 [Marine Group III euryarchaeote CG-Bathy1]
MKISIIGSGAMGILIAMKLNETENNISLVATRETAEKIERRGVVIVEGITEIENKIKIDEEIPNADWHILAVKNYHLDNIIPELKKYKSNILTCQNGLKAVRKLSTELDEERIVGMVTSVGSTVIERGHVKHTGEGYTKIGEMNGKKSERVLRIVEKFNNAGIKTEITDNLKGEIWLKGIVNSAINPVTAIASKRNGALIDGALNERARKICEEGMRVAEKYEIEMPENPWKKTMEIITLTSDNESSMLQDVKKGRKTEIDAINGEIARLGKNKNIETPENDKIIEEMLVYA